MKTKEEIIEILMRCFKDVYCDTCSGEYCEDCYRKNMNWEISETFAEIVANQILKD